MDLLYAIVPFSTVLLTLAILGFFWAVRSNQFDDLDSPAHRILFDDDEPEKPAAPSQEAPSQSTTDDSDKTPSEK